MGAKGAIALPVVEAEVHRKGRRMRVATSIWRTCGKAIGWLSNRSWALQLLLGLLVVGIIGIIDYLTGTELGLSIFYLAAVMPVAWTGGSFAGAFMSIVAALVWLAADRAAGHRYTYAAIPYWEMVIRLGFFLVVAGLLSRLRSRCSASKSWPALTPLPAYTTPTISWRLPAGRSNGAGGTTIR